MNEENEAAVNDTQYKVNVADIKKSPLSPLRKRKILIRTHAQSVESSRRQIAQLRLATVTVVPVANVHRNEHLL